MSEPDSRRGRVHDAEGTRTAILDAAEEVFAEHGFDGARIDVIAAKSGYNKSLIFHYFGDKLGLYTEVLRRADLETRELQAQVLAPLMENEMVTKDATRFRALLEVIVRSLFDYLLERPLLSRMIMWEQAEGWQTYVKVAARFDTEDVEMFEALFRQARNAGFLRSDFAPAIQLSLALQVCLSYIRSLPMYQTLQPDEDLSSKASLERAREQIVKFVVAGMMIDIPETKP